MAAFQTRLCVLLSVLSVGKVCALESYVAAVYEHAVILPNVSLKPVSPAEALSLMNKNMDVLEKAVAGAAAKGAHIIVTPEDGLYGFFFTRETIYPYLEDIPDPEVTWNPCTDPKRFGPTPVLERLSCMAKNKSIYVAANMGDKKPCNSTDVTCPKDGRYQYNTNVVFDAEGKLVARYHKYNLYSNEKQFDTPKEPQLVTFNTTFGKFGIFTCYDILFHDPAVALVTNLSVDTVLFPTAWINVLPYMAAIQLHSAWAMGMGVNLLAADTHSTFLHMTGNGIYAPDRPKAYYYNSETEDGRLVLAEVLSHPRLTSLSSVSWSEYARSIAISSSKSNQFSSPGSWDNVTFTRLDQAEGNLTTCQTTLCCHLSYKMVKRQDDELFVLGAYNGLHGSVRKYYIQVCTLLKCKSIGMDSCGEKTETSVTMFEFFSLSGTFRTSFVFPEVLLSGMQLAPGDFKVLSDGRLVSQSSISSRPLLSATLFGRWYQKDPPPKENAIKQQCSV
ncbi:pantetheinase-like [Ambystoma mexicanum]|uniref:pantetheinase-like n=1 Tax=Ambystoma mexicanum TaxID=8296 RepID=UPI0037E958FF